MSATLTDGTTTLTWTDSDFHSDTEIELSRAKSAGAVWKTQVAGERMVASESLRLTEAQYRSLVNLLKSNYNYLYYTPAVIPAEYTSSQFPMKVIVDLAKKASEAYSGAVIYHIKLEIQSSELL